MHFIGVRATRLLLVTAAFEGMLGLGIHIAPRDFAAPSYAPLRPFFPHISVSLVAGAIVLLLLSRYALRPLFQRTAVLVSAAPLLLLGYVLGMAGLRGAPIIYTGLGLGVLCIPWFGNGTNGPELFDLTSGLIHMTIGALMLTSPGSFPHQVYFAIEPLLPLAGATALVGAGAMLLHANNRWWDYARRIAGALFPCWMIYNSVQSDLTIGVISWSILAIGSLIGRGMDWSFRGVQQPRAGTLEHLDRSLETWSWLIALAVLLAGVFDLSGPRPDGSLAINLFVLTVTAYTTLAHWVLPNLGSPEARVWSHFVFLTLALGILSGDASLGGYSPLVLLILPPVLASHSLSVRAGFRLLAVAIAGAVLGDLLNQVSEAPSVSPVHFLGHVTGQSLALAAAGFLGVSQARKQWQLLTELTAARLDLQRQVRQLRLIDRIGAAIRSSLDLQEILRTTAAELGRVVSACRCIIYQTEPGGDLRPAAEYIVPGVLSATKPCHGDLTVVHMAAEARQVVSVADPDNGCAVLAAPIMAEGQLLGVISFHQCEGPLTWNADEVAFVEALAGQVGVAVLHARIHQGLANSEALLREGERRFRSAFGDAPIGMALTDRTGRWFQVNRCLADMLGYTVPELEQMKPWLVTHPDDLELTRRTAASVMSGVLQVHFEKRFLHRDGRPIWALVSASGIASAAGPADYAILHIQDITERKRTESQLVHLANYDTLTGLYNRHRFQEELKQELCPADRKGAAGAVLFIDVDQFKYVNDTLGHQAGDELLKSIAALLRRCLRDTGIIARLGGDEFAIVLPATSSTQACLLAHELLEALRRHITVVGGQPVTVTASIGISLYPDHGVTSEELLARADLAMFQAKEKGRDGCLLYQPDENEQTQMESKLTWERRIREALEHDSFVLYFQPILDLRHNRVVHYEVLLRLLDSQGQIVLPGAFLHVAERFGLIHAIDRWVVQRAIRLMAAREAIGQPICLEVNLSGKAFSDPELLPLIHREILATGIDPKSLILEITETAAIADTNLARDFIKDLNGLGCRFAIDDFGAGFSSFSHLKHLPVNYLKIDGGFISNLPNDPVDQHLVKTIVELARGLGKETIAEFVGDRETLSLLREYGVDFAQGYYVGRPCALDELYIS